MNDAEKGPAQRENPRATELINFAKALFLLHKVSESRGDNFLDKIEEELSNKFRAIAKGEVTEEIAEMVKEGLTKEELDHVTSWINFLNLLGPNVRAKKLMKK